MKARVIRENSKFKGKIGELIDYTKDSEVFGIRIDNYTYAVLPSDIELIEEITNEN